LFGGIADITEKKFVAVGSYWSKAKPRKKRPKERTNHRSERKRKPENPSVQKRTIGQQKVLDLWFPTGGLVWVTSPTEGSRRGGTAATEGCLKVGQTYPS